MKFTVLSRFGVKSSLDFAGASRNWKLFVRERERRKKNDKYKKRVGKRKGTKMMKKKEIKEVKKNKCMRR